MILAAAALVLALDRRLQPSRTEVCYAYSRIVIEDAMRESGRVAGPSWFISDWWEERLTDRERDEMRQTAVVAQMRARISASPSRYRREDRDCVERAERGGALP